MTDVADSTAADATERISGRTSFVSGINRGA
jgi:hypothetical protein